MPSPPEVASAFRDSLWSGAPPPGVTARDPAEVGRRFRVYRNNVAHGLAQALAARFPVVRRLVGQAFFAAMARTFIESHPPATPVLLSWGTALPAFLEGFPPVAVLPYLADVARLEIALGRAYHAADAPPLPPEALAALARDPDAARLVLHPSVRVVASRFAVVTIWRANQPGAVSRPLAVATPETALVLRERSLDVAVHGLSPAEAAFLAALSSGGSLLAGTAAASRAEPGYDPARLLATLVRAGALVAASLSPEETSP